MLKKFLKLAILTLFCLSINLSVFAKDDFVTFDLAGAKQAGTSQEFQTALRSYNEAATEAQKKYSELEQKINQTKSDLAQNNSMTNEEKQNTIKALEDEQKKLVENFNNDAVDLFADSNKNNKFADDLNKIQNSSAVSASQKTNFESLEKITSNDLKTNQDAAQKNLEVLETFSVTQVLKLPGQDAPKFLETVKSGPSNSPIIGIFFWLITFLIRIIGSIAVLISVAGGFIIMVSSGNDQRVEQGKNMIKFSLIGVAVAFSSFIIASFIQSIVVGQ